MKRLLLLLLSFAWLSFIPSEARACTCLEYDVPVCAAYWRADAVFVGQLLDITPVENTSERQLPTAAHVSVYDGERYVRMVKLDEKGRFKFKVYGDFKYAIVAEIWGQTMGKSDRVSITNEKSTGLTLVLKQRE